MADGVTEIEDSAVIIFTLVFLDDPGFDRARSRNDLNEKLAIQADDFVHLLFQKRKQSRVFDDPVLDYFSKAGDEFPTRQRPQNVHVDQDDPGLIEGADQVFAVLMIHAGFAADARIDLSQQRRWHLDVRNAAQIASRSKTCKISDNSSSQCHDARLPVKSIGNQSVVDGSQRLKVLVFLAVGNEHGRHFESSMGKRFVNRVEIELGNRGITDDRHLAIQTRPCEKLSGSNQNSVTDIDRVRAIPQAYAQGLH